MNENRIALPRLIPKLLENYEAPVDVFLTYPVCYKLVLNGRIPTTVINNRHYIENSNIQMIAAVLKLKTRAKLAA